MKRYNEREFSVRRVSPLRKFWNFLKKDTWQSWVVSLILLVLIIRFVIFPTLSFLTGSSLPLVVVESCSMYHDSNFDDWWSKNSEWYESKSITKEQFASFSLKNGFNKGDIIFVWGRSEIKLGNVIIFEPNVESIAQYPIIHRVVTLSPISTKGDNGRTNPGQLVKGTNSKHLDETNISQEQIIGRAVFRIPALGWVKLIIFQPFKQADGLFCS